MRTLIALIATAVLAGSGVALAAGSEGRAEEATTVKSSRSNSQDRTGGAPAADAAEGTTVKGSKSNSSERAGGAASGRGTTVKSGKSNTSE